MANMVVSGLTNHSMMGPFANYNGVYIENGIENGRSVYTHGTMERIHWTGYRWQLSHNEGWGDERVIQSSYLPTAPTPDLVVDWYGWDAPAEDDETILPNVTVTAEGGEPEPPAKKYRYKPVSQLTGSIRQLGT